MNLPSFKHLQFDIDKDSLILKQLVGRYDTDEFMGQIAVLLSMIGPPIPYAPFHILDSPMKMLTYMAGLNITAKSEERIPYVYSNLEWKRIIMQMVRIKAGYYELFLPPKDADKEDYYKFYKVSMPVFMDYFNSGPTNFEEQEINRIMRLFSTFDSEIIAEYNLCVRDFINIYEQIDRQLSDNLNRYTTLLKNPICREFWDKMKEQNINPVDWIYEGNDEEINELITDMKYMDERFKIKRENLYAVYEKKKIDTFLELLSLKAQQNDSYCYYTQDNIIMGKPLFNLKDGRILVMHDKQILKAIFDMLDLFCRNNIKTKDRYFKRRGIYLHEKTSEVFDKFFNEKAFIYSEYKTVKKGQDRQDLLVIHKGLALIVEIKAGDRIAPQRNTMKAFEQIYYNFKRNIQKGYEQTYRVQKLFDNNTDFGIYDNMDNFLHNVKTKKFHDTFSIIVTLDRFGPVQTDLTNLLKFDEGERYPLSISIDDLETLMLTMRKLKKGIGDFIRFLKYREKLQGKLLLFDELSIWGEFIVNSSFKPFSDSDLHFMPGERANKIFDEVYLKGLGLPNEKELDKKRSNRWITFIPSQVSEAGRAARS